jgi:hypothetical protein
MALKPLAFFLWEFILYVLIYQIIDNNIQFFSVFTIAQ